ncbi:multidrug transporter MdtB [Phaeobacter piscinae]|uniref:Multidrug transporter MdtB n=1 Tax=Phaeobacter piscinae TaxID=1580596 RepID=A0AAN1GS75_9RHOB|nr:efflux RND transporter permease subunit [Phaeobacter piscinae]ATG44217.1 multidrug transporter MdtB [Phaeobacter piscinae]AUR36527.1 multidrug transporter MdtB [Phaeobacter piscinae]
MTQHSDQGQHSDRGLSALSIRRPLLAMVMNLLIVLAGFAAFMGLDVRELPNVDRPFVMVRANYPGASPSTVDSELTSPLEDAVARVSGVRRIGGSSEEGSTRVWLEFEPGTNLDVAATDVREAVSQVEANLPSRVEKLTITKTNADAEPIVQIAVVADQFAVMDLSDRIENDIMPRFYSIPGIASVELFGVRNRQLRIELDPLQLNRFQVSASDVLNALRNAPYDIPVGSYLSKDQELLVRADASAITEDQVEQIQINEALRVGDVAQAYFSPETAENFVRLNGEPAIGLGILRQANSNTVEISDGVHNLVAALNDRYTDLTFTITSDQAVFIKSATSEVVITLLLTIFIVVLSILLFFGKLRPTLIPSLAIPAALIGSLASFWLFGFSINLITLLALVLATGLTVDDAIVVLENCQRRQALGESSRQSALIGTRQVFFAVLATTAVLVAVFVPISFLPSSTGRLFREFGLVLAVSVCISSFVALTLVPAMAARMNLAVQNPKKGLVHRAGAAAQQAYMVLVRKTLAHPILMIGGCLIFLGAIGFISPQIQSELAPSEDRSQLEIMARGPDGVGIEYMQKHADSIEDILLDPKHNDVIASVYTIVGRRDKNRVSSAVTLVPWQERSQSHQEILAELNPALGSVESLRARGLSRGSLELGWGSRAAFQAYLTGPRYDLIHQASLELAQAMEAGPFEDVEISYNPTQPQISFEIDRASAADLGVSLDDLGILLRVLVGGEELVDLNIDDQAVPIVVTGPNGFLQDPMDLQGIYISSETGTQVPLSSVTRITQQGVASELDRAGQRRSIEIEAEIGDLPLSDAIVAFQELAEQVLPQDIDHILTGEAQGFIETNRDILLSYAFVCVIVFLVLVAQFESLKSPLVVFLTVPFGLAATLGAMIVQGQTLNIYSQIGLILLIGLMTKNAILLVEFADQEQRMGKELRLSVENAAAARLRPIVMTLLSTMLGALPLILSTGAGAEARAAIGWTVFVGLGLSSFFTLFLAPSLYVLLKPKRN